MMGGMMLLNGIFWIALLGLGVWVVWRASNRGPAATVGGGLAVLEERYARGEIGREEYLEKRADLTSGKR